MRAGLLLLACALGAGSARAGITLAPLVSDHAVLQRDSVLTLRGRATAHEQITLAVDDSAPGIAVAADEQGAFALELRTGPAGGPHTLTLRGASEVRVSDVWFGEVWLCAGESNMEMPLAPRSEAYAGVDDAAAVIAAADEPSLRIFDVDDSFSPAPRERCQGRWSVSSAAAAPAFPATAYFFGRELQRELHVPVGIVVAAVGGSRIEAWVGASGLRAFPGFAPYLERMDKAVREPKSPESQMAFSQDWPSALCNGMIAPLVGSRFAGAVWYQGESNRGQAQQYRELLPALITDWRARLGAPALPFLIVQLAPFRARTQPEGLPLVREAQAGALTLPATSLVVTLDLGEEDRMQSRHKRELGRRTANTALARVYGRTDVACEGPRLRAAAFEGASARLSFEHGHGLQARGGELAGFTLADATRRFHAAQARIEGESVIVSSPEVPHPIAVRYGWGDWTAANLVNDAGLPCAPFRSDDW